MRTLRPRAIHCSNCGVEIQRLRSDRKAICHGCRMARNRELMREYRATHTDRRRAERATRQRPCTRCGTPLPLGHHAVQRYCEPCGVIRTRERQRRNAAHRRREVDHNATPSGGAVARIRADRTINQGKCCRRCECGQLYHLDALGTPCPRCHSHLSDNPLEARNVEAAA